MYGGSNLTHYIITDVVDKLNTRMSEFIKTKVNELTNPIQNTQLSNLVNAALSIPSKIDKEAYAKMDPAFRILLDLRNSISVDAMKFMDVDEKVRAVVEFIDKHETLQTSLVECVLNHIKGDCLKNDLFVSISIKDAPDCVDNAMNTWVVS